MLNYIVLGQVPGTDLYLTFTSVLVIYAAVLAAIVVLCLKNLFFEIYEIDPTAQVLTETSAKSQALGILPAIYTSAAIWLIVKYYSFSIKSIKNTIYSGA